MAGISSVLQTAGWVQVVFYPQVCLVPLQPKPFLPRMLTHGQS